MKTIIARTLLTLALGACVASAQETHDDLVKKLKGQAGATRSGLSEKGSTLKTRGLLSRGAAPAPPAPPVQTQRRSVRFTSRGVPTNIQAATKTGNISVAVKELPATHQEKQQGGSAGEKTFELSYDVDPESQVTRRSILFKVNSTQFADGSSRIELAKLARAFKDPQLKGHVFVIEGHSSAEGSEHQNQKLSQARATEIVAQMISFGVGQDQLVPVGFGESKARYPDSSPEQLLAQDRRVEIYRLE